MRPHLYRIYVFALAFAVSMSGALAQPLVTEDEAKLPSAKMAIATRSVTRAPGIRLVAPEAGHATVPFRLKIVFETRGGSSIDPGSVKLTYLKTPLVDLTERVKTGISATGIEQRDVRMPAGEHLMRVSVTDNEGRNASSVIKLIVNN